MYVCIYVNIYICKCKFKCTYIHMQYINIHTHIYIYIYITFIYRLLAGQIPSKCRSVVAPAGHPGHLAAGSRVAVLYLMYLGHGVCYYWSILIYIYPSSNNEL